MEVDYCIYGPRRSPRSGDADEVDDEETEVQLSSKRRKQGDGINLSKSVFASADDFQNIIDSNVRTQQVFGCFSPTQCRTFPKSLPRPCGSRESESPKVALVEAARVEAAREGVARADEVDMDKALDEDEGVVVVVVVDLDSASCVCSLALFPLQHRDLCFFLTFACS